MKYIIPALVISSSVLAAPTSKKVIYGEDGRKDVFESSPLQQKLARSTPTMVNKSNIIVKEYLSRIELVQTSFADWLLGAQGSNPIKFPVCASERFAAQPNPGLCSGFLIAPDLVVTAGHCAEVENFCEDHKWIFDFKVNQATGKAGDSVALEDVYSCKKVITSSLEFNFMTDYAIVQLDRKVVGRQPLKIRTKGQIELGAGIYVIGNPSGLPLKVTEGGAVRKNDEIMFFDANLDTYQGNSGSAVFNASTNEIEGILVRGENDFVLDQANLCITSNKCTNEGCRGESVSRILSVPELAFYDLLMKASELNRTSVLEEILHFNVWVDINLADGKTPLMVASQKGSTAAAEFLLSKGANPNASDAKGNTALHYIAEFGDASYAELIRALVASGANPSFINSKGQTPLMVARATGNTQTTILLYLLAKK